MMTILETLSIDCSNINYLNIDHLSIDYSDIDGLETFNNSK
jgi:hypothetical protein